jgi:RNA polymerase primary sigma factor
MRRGASIVNGIDVTAHGGLIGRIVHKYKGAIGGCLEWEDLFQAGWLGLYRAAERFDSSRGFAFSTYANYWIRHFIQRAIMNERRTVRVPVHAQNSARQDGYRIPYDALSLDAPLDSADSGSATWVDFMQSESDPSGDAEQSDLADRVGAAVERLGEKDRRIVKGRFWRDRTLGEIGDDMGVSRERVRQREAAALQRLERILTREDLA